MIDFTNGVFLKLSLDKNPRLERIEPLLISGEEVISSYTTIRDSVIFTDKRIIAVNVQGITGKKVDYTSIPYSKISVFSVETAGVNDLDAELELYIVGLGKVKFEFSGRSDVITIGKCIANFVLV